MLAIRTRMQRMTMSQNINTDFDFEKEKGRFVEFEEAYDYSQNKAF